MEEVPSEYITPAPCLSTQGAQRDSNIPPRESPDAWWGCGPMLGDVLTSSTSLFPATCLLQSDATVSLLEAIGAVLKVKRAGLAAKKGCLIKLSRPFVMIDFKYTLSDSLLSLVSIAITRKVTSSCNLREKKGLFSSYSFEGSQGRNLETGTEAETKKETACEFALLACWFIHPSPTCPGAEPPTVGGALLHQFFIKKIPYRRAYRPVWWRHLLS